MNLLRIDNRLVHGQVIEAWLPYIGANSLIVANDDIAQDELYQQILKLAVPVNIQTLFCKISSLADILSVCDHKGDTYMILVKDCADAKRVYESGVKMPICNIGNLHFSEGKKQILPHMAVSDDDLKALEFIESRAVELDFRSIPADNIQSISF